MREPPSALPAQGGRRAPGGTAPSPAGMCETYSRWLLRVSVAQICQALGWDSVQVSACDLLTDVLQRYLQGLGRGCHRYCELCECGPGRGVGGCAVGRGAVAKDGLVAVWTRSWEAGCGWLCLSRGLDQATSISPCQPRPFCEGRRRSSAVGRGEGRLWGGRLWGGQLWGRRL